MKLKPLGLKIRFTLVAISISFVSFAVVFFLSRQWTTEDFNRLYSEKAMVTAECLIHSLGEAMLSGPHEAIARTLRFYRGQKNIIDLKIFNLKGEEVLPAQKGPSHAEVKECLTAKKTIHFDRQIGKQTVESYVIPISNEPECHRCHGRDDPLRGALLMSLSNKEMARDISSRNRVLALLFALTGIAISISVIIALNRLFLKPVSRIQKGTEAIERGDFSYRIPVESRDEIGILTEHFNHMAEILRRKNEELWEQFRLVSRSHKEWQETIDSITDLICLTDKDFNIIKANRAFHDYFLISPYSEIDKNGRELLGDWLSWDPVDKGEIPDRRPMIREVLDPRTLRMLQISVFPNYSADCRFTGSIFIAKDITEKKQYEMGLIMAERLTTLGQMAAGIAHEINNPLATISACTEGLIKRLTKGQFDIPLFDNYLKIIEEEVTRCKTITRSMLSFVRKPTGEKKEVDSNETLDNCLEMVGLQGRLKGVEVVKDYQERMPMFLGEEGKIRQVFLSILVNALDAMEEKGKLTLETRLEGEVISISITDTGQGIPPLFLGRIFDPFFTTKSARGGTGLGLAIADKIIKETGGKIEVSSEERKGTRFTITLPINPPSANRDLIEK